MRTATGSKLLGVLLGLALAGVLIGLYVNKLTLDNGSAAYTVPVSTQNGQKVVDLSIETVAAVGPQLSPAHPDYVSYLVRNTQGKWIRRTVWRLPAHATIHVTIYNFDSASGLRNPLYARPQGIDGNTFTLDGKSTAGINPDDTSHTFAVPGLGIVVPLSGIPDGAKNPCGYAPCLLSLAHRTIKFTFHTGDAGHFRWQCFVPCAAGWIDGFGGPMQTIGYMDGFLNVI
jgi:hypothetical protein